jgi:hypothetical protein
MTLLTESRYGYIPFGWESVDLTSFVAHFLGSSSIQLCFETAFAIFMDLHKLTWTCLELAMSLYSLA